MITITIHDASEYKDILTGGYHIVQPTFIQFLQGLSEAMKDGYSQIYVYDTEGQFATMPRWAMCEKIGELTGIATALQGHNIVMLTGGQQSLSPAHPQ